MSSYNSSEGVREMIKESHLIRNVNTINRCEC